MKNLLKLAFFLACFLMFVTNSFASSFSKDDIIAKYEWRSGDFVFEAGDGRMDVFDISFTVNSEGEPDSITVSWDINDVYVVCITLKESTDVHEYIISGGSSWDSSDYNYDHAISNITIYGAVSHAPIPGAVWLLGSGILGLAGIRRKFRKG